MSALRTASITLPSYAPNTQLGWVITVADDYDLTGKEVDFEILDPETRAVAYRVTSGVDANLSISGQVVTLALQPTKESPDFDGVTFADAVAGECVYDIALNFRIESSTVVDYRIQGPLTVLPSHGPF